MAFALSACAPSTSRFDVILDMNHRHQVVSDQVTLYEIGAQGSSILVESPTYSSHKTTVGGSYLRGIASDGTYRVHAGLQGNPFADK